LSKTDTTSVHTAIGKHLDDLGYAYGARKRNSGESDQSYRQAIIDRLGKPQATELVDKRCPGCRSYSCICHDSQATYTYARITYIVVNNKYFERLKMREINKELEGLS
jgi:hypothetical protein